MSTTQDPNQTTEASESAPMASAAPRGLGSAYSSSYERAPGGDPDWGAPIAASAAGGGSSGGGPRWGSPVAGGSIPHGPVPDGPGRRRGRVRMPLAAGAAALALVVGFGGSWFLRGTAKSPSIVTASDVSSVAARVDGALVDIVSTLGYENGESAGTGIVLTSNGEILTNNHVIDGATSIKVTDVGNGKTYTATVVGYDESDDVAVLQLQKASGLQTAHLSSSAITVGGSVVALGNAGGVGGTPSVASGTVTALDVSITAADESGAGAEQLTGMIETNAQLEPGDSGGALVNASGQVVGMDTAASSTSGSSGFQAQTTSATSYAIPITKAVSIAKAIESGRATTTVHIGTTAFLGVATSDSSTSGFGSSTTSGATVAGVVTGSAAATAGIVAGDVITAIGGTSVGSASALTAAMQAHHPGDKVSITWSDSGGTSHTATVVLGSGPAA